MTDDPVVSVIIPTYNSAATLAQCLQALQLQIYEKTEIIIVDSCSTDETISIARKSVAKIISTSWRLLGTRYQGFLENRGELSLLLDSDQVWICIPYELSAFFDAVSALKSDPALCKLMGENALRLGREKYNWGVMATRLQKLYRALDTVSSYSLSNLISSKMRSK